MSKELRILKPSHNSYIPTYREPDSGYPVFLERDYYKLGNIKKVLDLKERKILLVVDSNIPENHVCEVLRFFKEDASYTDLMHLHISETKKDLDTITSIYDKLYKLKFDREDVVVAFGGGATADLAGFAAATYLQGILYIQLPTTLFSMADGCLERNMQIDYKGSKNRIGVYHQPVAVYIGLCVLESLPERIFYAGFAEMIKHALILSSGYMQMLKNVRVQDIKNDYNILEVLIQESLIIKQKIMQADPTEKKEWMLLNFGHTIGHAVEKFTKFSLLHGECVSLGVVAAAYLSYYRNQISKDEFLEILAVLDQYNLPIVLMLSEDYLNQEEIILNLWQNKTNSGSLLSFILLENNGNAYIDTSITEEELVEAVSFIMGVKFI